MIPRENDGTRYPKDIIKFSNVNSGETFHPTQNPVDLLRYLILTYSNEGDTILDATIGSGTTAVAALIEHRHFIGFETDKDYYDKAVKRITEETRQLSLF
jgi:site-specific DNA-methyltransferase (adenine-specific)